MSETYRHYFDIDPEYFPQVNQAIIQKEPDIWKKFYPHQTFVKLLKDTLKVLTRKEKLSIWVEGAYGTGKSHAVLTLKKLLDASPEDTKAYFDQYHEQLSRDLYNGFEQVKNSGQKIITVHRYGSSNIRGDNSLVFAIQESIENALKENGIYNTGKSALKEATLAWLSDKANKAYFNSLAKESYSDLFGGDDVDEIIRKLKEFEGESLIELMAKISRVAEERQIKAFTLDTKELAAWIKNVISENNLKAIVFIWDEFTNYFENNLRALTGFQEIIEISATDPFYMIIVTHKSGGLFSESNKDKKRILDRFVKPTCEIALPENMAFQLMGAAMKKNQDPVVLEEWIDITDDLSHRTQDSRQLVQKAAGITDKELKNILPIQPYTALLLKHISSAFDSNQRSMFDFIKNDRGDEIKGFQWFIDNYSPTDKNPLLTIDMLWDFFYEKGKEYLAHDIRTVLDVFPRSDSMRLNEDEKRVLKTVLMLQAISQTVGDSVDLFTPNERNLRNAFEGSDFNSVFAAQTADILVRKKILYKKPLTGGKYQYAAMVNDGDQSEIDRLKEVYKKKQTSSLLVSMDMKQELHLSSALDLRCNVEAVGSNELLSQIRRAKNQDNRNSEIIPIIFAFAKNDEEGAQIGNIIRDNCKFDDAPLIVVDASFTPLGENYFEQYVEAMANSEYQTGKNNDLAKQYSLNAKDILRAWKDRVFNGEFVVYYDLKPDGEHVTTFSQLKEIVLNIDRQRYSLGLETGAPVTDMMWNQNSMKVGVKCGVIQKTSGAFKSGNKQTKLENYIGSEVWGKEGEYWIDKPFLLISQIKQKVEETIQQGFKQKGRISIRDIYEPLCQKPFGFMPCNLTAFVMGYVLKEYADNKYSWSDDINSDSMSLDKLQDMIDEIIKFQSNGNSRYHDKYLVIMSEEEKAFSSATSEIFGIPRNACISIENTRGQLRHKLKELTFPIWCLKNNLEVENLRTNEKAVKELIDLYTGIANSDNLGGKKTENDIAISIGKTVLNNNDLILDLKEIMNKENCSKGMTAFLHTYKDGELIRLADEIGDHGHYLNQLAKKMDADSANWLWSKDLVEKRIDDIIREYQIVKESNKILPQTNSYRDSILEWISKCKNIRISYEVGKNYFHELEPLMQLLYEISKREVLSDSKQEEFLNLLKDFGAAFKEYYSDQVSLFKDACGYYIEDFSAEEIKEIYLKLPTSSFLKSKAEYFSTLELVVERYKNECYNSQLKNFWKEKTNTNSPQEWSRINKMPILIMLDENDYSLGKKAFDVFEENRPNSESIQMAQQFLEEGDFYDRLNSEEERNKIFRKAILKNYSVMIDDLEDAKTYLCSKISVDPYFWLGLPEVDKRLGMLAQSAYDKGGSNKALDKIENMDVNELKHYLKDLIKDNMVVGIEIINTH